MISSYYFPLLFFDLKKKLFARILKIMKEDNLNKDRVVTSHYFEKGYKCYSNGSS